MTSGIQARSIPAVATSRIVDGDVQTWPSAANAAWRVKRSAGGTFLQLKDSATSLFGAVFFANGDFTVGQEEA